MTVDNVVLEIVERYASVSNGPVNQDQNLGELGVTSIKLIELVLDIEQEFGIVFPEEVLVVSNISSIARLVELIKAHSSV